MYPDRRQIFQADEIEVDAVAYVYAGEGYWEVRIRLEDFASFRVNHLDRGISDGPFSTADEAEAAANLWVRDRLPMLAERWFNQLTNAIATGAKR